MANRERKAAPLVLSSGGQLVAYFQGGSDMDRDSNRDCHRVANQLQGI